MSNCIENSQLRDKLNGIKLFNQNNDYPPAYLVHNFSEDDNPGDYTNSECEIVNLH